MNKFNKISLKKIIIFLVVLISLIFIGIPIFYRINPFNRIYGNLTITENGSIIELSKNDIKSAYSYNLNNNNNGIYLSTKGDDYGIYTYNDIPKVNYSIDYTNLSETYQKIKYNTYNSKILENNSIEIYRRLRRT